MQCVYSSVNYPLNRLLFVKRVQDSLIRVEVNECPESAGQRRSLSGEGPCDSSVPLRCSGATFGLVNPRPVRFSTVKGTFAWYLQVIPVTLRAIPPPAADVPPDGDLTTHLEVNLSRM